LPSFAVKDKRAVCASCTLLSGLDDRAPKSLGHEREFIAAAKGEIAYNAPLSHFGYGGKLTAVALMGNIAAQVKGKLLYDGKKQCFTNSDAANKLMNRKPRDGWFPA
jgi:hypothetical protein